MKRKKLSSNMEDYLEAIAVLKKKNGIVRVRDISRFLNVKTPSVASALNTLSKEKLVVHERYGYVDFKPEGEKAANAIQKRHKVLIEFLTHILKIDSKVAEEDACRVEHFISPQTFENLTKFLEFIEGSPLDTKPKWLKGFNYYLKTGNRRKCRIRQFKQKAKK